jgi:hypothetical protein
MVVIVYNFIDLLSHVNTELEMIRELAGNDSAYRSLVLSWFNHFPAARFHKDAGEKILPSSLLRSGSIR